MKRIFILIGMLALIFNIMQDCLAQAPQEPLNPSVTLGTDNAGPVRKEGMIGRFPSSFLDTVNAEDDSYDNTLLSKAGDGFINATTFWAEIPEGVAEVTQESNIFVGMTVGVVKGTVAGLARGASGASDMVTCAAPPYDKPAMKPKFKVDNAAKNTGYKVKLMQW